MVKEHYKLSVRQGKDGSIAIVMIPLSDQGPPPKLSENLRMSEPKIYWRTALYNRYANQGQRGTGLFLGLHCELVICSGGRRTWASCLPQ